MMARSLMIAASDDEHQEDRGEDADRLVEAVGGLGAGADQHADADGDQDDGEDLDDLVELQRDRPCPRP
jgi:hypothetical protein